MRARPSRLITVESACGVRNQRLKLLFHQLLSTFALNLNR